MVFQLLAKLGITLTPAERVAISERPTRDIQAFLLYSRGLETGDRGDFAAAAGFFGAAARLDPGFSAAAQQAAASDAAQAASSATPADLAATIASSAAAAPSQGTLASGINSAVPTGTGAIDAVSTSTTPGFPMRPTRVREAATCDGLACAALVGSASSSSPAPRGERAVAATPTFAALAVVSLAGGLPPRGRRVGAFNALAPGMRVTRLIRDQHEIRVSECPSSRLQRSGGGCRWTC